MATVNTEDALAEYQRRAGDMYNEIVMAHIAIASLEAEVTDLRQRLLERSNVDISPATEQQ